MIGAQGLLWARNAGHIPVMRLSSALSFEATPRFLRGLATLGVVALVGAASGPSAVAVPVAQADHLLVLKSKRVMLVMRNGRVLEAWPISLGRHPIGPKRVAGDRRTPEGDYVIDGRIPNSRFHLSLHISYPNATDIERARTRHVSPGGDIAIHGLPEDYHPIDPAQPPGDWTDGCIALDNHAIESVWQRVEVGTLVTIRP